MTCGNLTVTRRYALYGEYRSAAPRYRLRLLAALRFRAIVDKDGLDLHYSSGVRMSDSYGSIMLLKQPSTPYTHTKDKDSNTYWTNHC